LLWEQIVTRSLNKREKYSCISKKTMVGQLILLFAKDEMKHRLSYLRTSKVKTGLGGQGGNKGSVAVRFNFDDSTFAFMNCHLASGQNEIKERLSDLK
jgi:synaptojanin